MRFIRFIKKIQAGYYEVYTSGSSEPFTIISRISSHHWCVTELYSGRVYDFDTLTQCKSYLCID